MLVIWGSTFVALTIKIEIGDRKCESDHLATWETRSFP